MDHPARQAWELERLAEAQLAIPPWLILEPVDFERDDLGKTLVGAGFHENSPAFFTWLGVVPYLTQDAIGSTLDYMASIQNSEVLYDYMEPPRGLEKRAYRLTNYETGETLGTMRGPVGLRFGGPFRRVANGCILKPAGKLRMEIPV